MFFLSSFLVIILNSEKIINDLKERIPVVVFLKENITTIEFTQFEKKLKINEKVKSFDFITKEFRFNHKPKFIGGILENECSILMKDFFKAKRG